MGLFDWMGKQKKAAPAQPLTDAEYERLFLQVLQGTASLEQRGNDPQMVAWLERWGEKLLAEPKPNHELANFMLRLGAVGKVREVSAKIATELLAKSLPIVEAPPIDTSQNQQVFIPSQSEPSAVAQEFYHQGIEYLNKQEYAQALGYFEQAIGLQDNYTDAWYQKGIALQGLQRWQEAIEANQRFIDLTSGKQWKSNSISTPNYTSISVEDILGASTQSSSYYSTSESSSTPDNAEAERWFNLGDEKFMQGDLLSAIDSYDKAIQIKPDFHQAWHNRGSALGNLGRHEEAIASYDKAIQIKPDDHEAWNNRGFALYTFCLLYTSPSPRD